MSILFIVILALSIILLLASIGLGIHKELIKKNQSDSKKKKEVFRLFNTNTSGNSFNLDISKVITIALSFLLVLSVIVMIYKIKENSQLKTANAKLQAKINQLTAKQANIKKNISRDPALKILSNYDYNRLKKIFNNMPYEWQILLVDNTRGINNYAEFLELPLDTQIKALNGLFDSWGIRDINVRFVMLQENLYINAELAKIIVTY